MDSVIFALIVIGVIIASVIKQLNKKAEESERERQPEPKQPYEAAYQEYQSPPTRAKAPSPNKPEQPKKVSPPPVQTTPEQEFDIHSMDEVRRAIIWSEILNRKY